MRTMTRAALSAPSGRAWRECFGPPAETLELPAATEADRLFACAVVLADDLRSLPEFGLAEASADERFLFAYVYVRLLRDIEAGRIGDWMVAGAG